MEAQREVNKYIFSWICTAATTLLMHKPTRKAVTKCIKATAGAGLTLLQAHPVAAAVTVTVVVVGVTAYYINKNSKNDEREGDLIYSSGRPKHQPETTNCDPMTQTDSAASNVAGNNIRTRRKVCKSASSTTAKSHPDSRDERKSNLTSSKGTKTEASGNHRNIDDGKISPGINFDSDMSGEEKVTQWDISQNDPRESTSHSNGNLDENSTNSSGDLVSSNHSDGSFEDLTDVDVDVRSGSSVCSVLSGESDCCRACNNRVNTHMIPCNHRYLCHDCAGRILRIYKRCKICRSKIESYCVEVS